MAKHNTQSEAVYRIISQQRDNSLLIAITQHAFSFYIKAEEILAHPDLLSGFNSQDAGIILCIAEEEGEGYKKCSS